MIVLEFKADQLELKIPDFMKQQVNLNQELYLDVVYTKNPDEAFYSLVIEYK